MYQWLLAVAKAILGAIGLYETGKRLGAEQSALDASRAKIKALQTRVEIDHAVEQAAAGGASDLAALARSSGLQRPDPAK